MTLVEKQNQMISEINALGDCFDQYAYLLVKAQELPGLPAEFLTPENHVNGCQSDVWLIIHTGNGRLSIEADSDTLILRGVLRILQELFEDAPLAEAASLNVCLFTDTELGATFTSDRNTGVKTILKRIADTAAGS